MDPTSPSAAAPRHAARRLLARGAASWALVALAEAAAYAVLAWAILRHDAGSPGAVAAVVAAAGIALGVTVLSSRGGFLLGARFAAELYGALGGALARVKLGWLDQDHRALAGEAAGRGVPTLMGLPAHQMQTLVCSPLLPILLTLATGALLGAAPALLLAALVLGALAAHAACQWALGRIDARRRRAARANAAASLELVDHLALLSTTPGAALERSSRVWRDLEAAQLRSTRSASVVAVASSLASALPLAGALLYLAAAGLAPAEALAFLVLAARASAPLEDLALIGLSLGEIRGQTAALREVLAAPTLRWGGPREPRGHDLEIAGVNGVSARIPAGARVHLAGPTGAGKSTLLKLLVRFDDPPEGAITLGGVPLNELGEDQLARLVSYVPQDPILFTGTLAENISLGRESLADADVERYARRARLGDVIDRHPAGIHQPVGERGAALSGGEQQRVTLARALAGATPILLLDEATSALDVDTEREVAGALGERTVVVVTHRDPGVWRPTGTIALRG
ncbi:ATP-binding cassette domain-containing protein [Corynebacterium otitidis]